MNSILKHITLICSITVTFVILTAVNYHFAISSPGGSDFLPRWVATRGLFQKESPYSENIASQAQNLFYGRPILPGEDELLEVYPIYAYLFITPFALINDYIIARSLWMTILEVLVITTFFVSLRIINWKPKIVILVSLIFFFIFWYNSIRSIVNGNIVILATFLLTSTLWAIKVKKDAVAGLLLALATIKPNLALLPVLFILIWMARAQRWRFLSWFGGSMTFMVSIGVLIVPNWLIQILGNISHYNAYTPPHHNRASTINLVSPRSPNWMVC